MTTVWYRKRGAAHPLFVRDHERDWTVMVYLNPVTALWVVETRWKVVDTFETLTAALDRGRTVLGVSYPRSALAAAAASLFSPLMRPLVREAMKHEEREHRRKLEEKYGPFDTGEKGPLTADELRSVLGDESS